MQHFKKSRMLIILKKKNKNENFHYDFYFRNKIFNNFQINLNHLTEI